MEKQLNKRIAVIGAGPAGLGAAEALREKGYTNITLFDKRNRVGGLALTCKYVTPGNETVVYDMGSVQPLSSANLLRLLKKYKLEFGRGPLANKSRAVTARSYLQNEELVNYLKHYLGVPASRMPDLIADVAKLGKYLWRYRRLRKPGFYNFGYWNETSGSFKEWTEKRDFKVIGKSLPGMVFNLMTLGNKNNEDQVKVYAVFKLLYEFLKMPMRYIDGTYRPVRQGFQELWIRVSKNFNVILEADIKSITRNDTGVTIVSRDGSYEFDELIISCPFDRIAHLLDARPMEKEVFTNIIYNPGYRGAFIAKNGPADGVYWNPDSYDTGDAPPYLAMVIPEGKVADNTYLYSCVFSHCPDQANAVKVLQASAEKVFRDQHAAEITEWVNMQYWQDYGCLFGIDAVNNRVYDKIQAMQGNFRTYYTGQLVSFSANSIVLDYSYDLVNLFF